MPVKIYTGEDSEQNILASAHTGEVEGILNICRRLWSMYQNQPELYTLVASLSYPRADVIILTENGIGVVELKHNEGQIKYYNSDQWFIDGKPIKSGADYRSNPHEQVRQYARTLRNRLIYEYAPLFWKKYLSEFQKLKIQTAVCFTNSNVDFSELKEKYRPRTEFWDSFKILGPSEIVDWTFALRFGFEVKDKNGTRPFSLRSEDLDFVTRHVLRSKEWQSVYTLMPNDKPYGYLLISENAEKYIMPIRGSEVLIGRDTEECQVVTPIRCEKVSRKHARLVLESDGWYLTDISKNGTYLSGKRVTGAVHLTDNTRFTLGGPDEDERTCLMRFISDPEKVVRLRTTELGLKYVETSSDLPTSHTTLLGNTDHMNEIDA